MKDQQTLLALKSEIKRLAKTLSDKIADPKLKAVFYQCFINTIETTVMVSDTGGFIITGDIPAMWLRDCAAQIRQYLPFIKESAQLKELFRLAIGRTMDYVLKDPYANAFNMEENGNQGDDGDITQRHPLVWERKYEIDSLCSVIAMIHEYWKESGDASVFTDKAKQAFTTILDIWETEQYHAERSHYRFQRVDCPPTDTLSHQGKGTPVAHTGMTWCGFRPSDDACVYGYLVPSNMFAVVALGYLTEIAQSLYQDTALAQRAETLREEIREGIEKFAIVHHETYGDIYAYETDGLGNHLLMDDANVPSLLAMPYFGYCSLEDPLYQNTRRFILSQDNPFYYAGTALKGVGSPHTVERYVWPISLCIQGLTSENQAEIDALLQMLIHTENNTGFIHESVHADDPALYSREWFAWANSLFASFVYKKHIAKVMEGGK